MKSLRTTINPMTVALVAIAASGVFFGTTPHTDSPTVFALALDNCTPMSLQTPHPLVGDFTILHTVAGDRDDGRCAYEQTMPDGMAMECQLSAEGRAALAEDIRAQARAGTPSVSSSAPRAEWASDCAIMLASGESQPVGG